MTSERKHRVGDREKERKGERVVNKSDALCALQVIMADRPAAERACKDPNPIIDGRKANVNLAILGAKPRGNLQAGESLKKKKEIHLVTSSRL